MERPTSDPEPKLIAVGGQPAAYTEEGTGRPVVAVHGLPGSSRDFRYLAPALSGRVRFIRVDIPGYGASPPRENCRSPMERSRFVLDAIDALELEAPIVAGHSMGGVLSVAVAVGAPGRFAGLALISSPGLRMHKGFRTFPRKRASAILSLPFAETLLRPSLRRAFAKAGFRGPYPKDALADTIHSIALVDLQTHAARVRQLKLQTLVTYSKDDPLIEQHISEELAAACPEGPRLVFDDGGHNPQKFHAQEIADALATWAP